MVAHKPHQLDQGLRSEQGQVGLGGEVGKRGKGAGKVGPVPGQGEHQTIVTAQGNPGGLLAPEDPPDPSFLPAGATLLRQDRSSCSLKCNIGCCLFWG